MRCGEVIPRAGSFFMQTLGYHLVAGGGVQLMGHSPDPVKVLVSGPAAASKGARVMISRKRSAESTRTTAPRCMRATTAGRLIGQAHSPADATKKTSVILALSLPACRACRALPKWPLPT